MPLMTRMKSFGSTSPRSVPDAAPASRSSRSAPMICSRVLANSGESLEAGTAEDQLARELVLAKYAASEEDLDEWGPTSLAVVVAFPADIS